MLSEGRSCHLSCVEVLLLCHLLAATCDACGRRVGSRRRGLFLLSIQLGRNSGVQSLGALEDAGSYWLESRQAAMTSVASEGRAGSSRTWGHHFGKGAPAQGSRWGSLVLSEDYFKIDTYRISKPGLSGSVSCRDTVAEKETPPRFLCPGNRTRAGWLSSSRSNL